MSAPKRAPATLTRRQKAAVIVQLLLSGGVNLPLKDMSELDQVRLTAELAGMRSVDTSTLTAVVQEFIHELESIGLSFPKGIEGALSVLEGHISTATSARLRREAGVVAKGDPWERIAGLENERLVPVLQEEAVEVGAVMLSKLSVQKAAELLGLLPGERARRISYAISQTAEIGPETVRRIGLSISDQLEAVPVKAFEAEPVERVGAILNSSVASTREDVLEGLDQTDAAFAERVRKAIFTFTNIPARVAPRDIPKAIRGIEATDLLTALASAKGEDEKSRDFILENMSKRMADNLREEMAEITSVKEKDAEAAQSAVVASIRALEQAGEILLIADEADE
ncbi:FliG C-terminal domain-containing protein [Actibacterium sp. 188UL27-1]|uniref:flagellar motor switch protein FliG n=1 Tax=Actibacterium sp. 188UL27-1 TaxID=2786961 RepID=UPI00195642F0|nr:flagellar motor switch protein FliG [Actibacterium sp. 188UL27-1]